MMGKFDDIPVFSKFADLPETPAVSKFADVEEEFAPMTIAWVIERVIVAMNGLDGSRAIKPHGTSHLYTLRRLQRQPIGAIDATKLTDDDIKAHAEMRIKTVCAATINGDIGYLNGALKYAKAAWKDCKAIQVSVIDDVRPFLLKHGYVGKSTPRTRRPQTDENATLEAHFSKPPKKKFKKHIDMVKMMRWQLVSTRRIGESCRLMWGDWRKDDQTILVRGMKHPTKKDHDVVVALPVAAQAMLIELEKERLTPSDPAERIFKYNAKSVGQKFTKGKKLLGIQNLHLHDSRRDGATRLVEDDGYSVEQAILATGHVSPTIFERNYLSQKPELFKNGPRGAPR